MKQKRHPYSAIIGEENISYDAKGEPVISDAGYDRLAAALVDGRIPASPEVIESARQTRAEVAKIRKVIEEKSN